MKNSSVCLLLITLVLFSCKEDDDNNICTSLPSLTTSPASEFVRNSVTLSGIIKTSNCDEETLSQGFLWSETSPPTISDNLIEVEGEAIEYRLKGLDWEKAYYYRTFLTNTKGTYYGNEISFETDTFINAVYLDSNGVTIKAHDWAEVGDLGLINGKTIYVVDEKALRDRINKKEELFYTCVSKVSDMSNLFFNWTDFNQDIGSWDVSNVTTMKSMFANLYVFNQNLNSWDVSKVTDMERMFYNNTLFNKNITGWNVFNVLNMKEMFADAFVFNQNISSWNVSNVTNMKSMFSGTNSFNQGIGSWNVSSVLNMEGMFANIINFNQALSSWNVSNVTNMKSMFLRARDFNGDLSSWDVSNVVNMEEMFANTANFNQDLSSWDVSNVTECASFSTGRNLLKPNFTRCTP